MSVSRGRPMAVACAGAIATSLGAIYLVGLDTKRKEGLESPYKKGEHGESDKRMSSSDVSAVVAVPRPAKQSNIQQRDPEPK